MRLVVKHIKILVILVLMGASASMAQGQTTYTASSGDWDGSGSIWTPSGVPGSLDHVIIPAGVSVKMETSATTVANLTLAGTLDLDKSDDDLTVTNNVTITGSTAVLSGDKGDSELIVQGNFNVNSGQQLTIQKTSVRVDGTSSIDGSLVFDDDDGTYQFGHVDINSTGTWNNTDKGDFILTGDLINDGSFIGCSSGSDCVYEFTNTTASITGSSSISFSDLIINSPAQVTSTATIIITDDFSGSGSFVNGNGASLELRNSTNLDVTTLDFSTDANDLVFAGDDNVSLPSATYHNIEVNFSDDKKKLNVDNDVTINNDLTLTDGKMEFDSGATVEIGGDVNVGVDSDEFKVKTSTVNIAGNVNMDGGKIKTDNASAQFNVTGNVDVNGGILELKKGATIVSGDLSMDAGEFKLGGNRGAESGSLTVEGTSSFSTTGNVEFNQGVFETLDFTIDSSTTISVNEEVSIDASGLTTINGLVNFEDAGDTPSWVFTDLTIDTSSDLRMTNNISVRGVLNLVNGNLILGDNTVELRDGATIIGGSSSSYIELNGSGLIRQYYTAAGATLNFPMGITGYSPITALTINSATFGVDAFLEFGLTESAHPERSTSNIGLGGDDDGSSASDYLNRFWTISSNNLTDPSFDIATIYIQSDVVGTESNLVGTLYRTPQGESFLDWLERGTVNPVTNTISIVNGDNWGDIYAMDNSMDRLPIELVMFNTKVIAGQVELTWATASETNNEFFSIERSTNGKDFQTIFTVKGAGNSDQYLEYTATDPFPLEGRSYYRLKQTDFTGEFEYSEIKSVLIETTPQVAFKLYPSVNQAGGILSISNLDALGPTSSIHAILIDMTGRTIELSLANGQIRLPSNLSSNVYIVKVRGEKVEFSQRIVIK